jgi:dTDP-4-dehydrorhamnose 3,5-epimerase-like enzyme
LTQNVFVYVQDGANSGIHARDPTGKYFTIIEDIRENSFINGETTGLTFSPDNMRMYVSYQLGYILEIWRLDGEPFTGDVVDIKYHTDTA